MSDDLLLSLYQDMRQNLLIMARGVIRNSRGEYRLRAIVNATVLERCGHPVLDEEMSIRHIRKDEWVIVVDSILRVYLLWVVDGENGIKVSIREMRNARCAPHTAPR
jgi:hypothetical protein